MAVLCIAIDSNLKPNTPLSSGLPVSAADVPVASRRPLSGPRQNGHVGASGQPPGRAAGPGAAPQQTQHHQGTNTQQRVNPQCFKGLLEVNYIQSKLMLTSIE